MRIDALSKINQLYQTNDTRKVSKTQNGNKKDSVEISQMGKDFQIAKQAVSSAPDIRQEKVDEIKKKLASGNYEINLEELADKMINDFFEE
ncbi:flagellar biosynthesis anti-sigma factor FlgM [Lachnoclostridium phytofermentans]|uniref:Negative regulator of flagellin synthesis n=1 Tax=Lachnoclostridium phytofermentans (strain ATCC 700394 / DSM 18823 / ISDg) TaxID=357809 RepID=A9KSP6_LACP7|nr:flagellar biosynthesis anti-sigma factor FlgM [Lachnoclostridium phytofermentans]ABX40690.1 anti-sigma-28 factor, FlgM [Lachnoclostridium phytofermentans ISDg]